MDLDNLRQIATDIPACYQTLRSLADKLDADESVIGEWLRVVIEMSEGLTENPDAVTSHLQESLGSAAESYGQEIARNLFNSMYVILPDEIPTAAKYISAGGEYKDLPSLGNAGVFMPAEDIDDIGMSRLISYMNAGGTAQYAFDVIKGAQPDTAVNELEKLLLQEYDTMKIRWLTLSPSQLIEEAGIIAAAKEITEAVPSSSLSTNQIKLLLDIDDPLQRLCEHWSDICTSCLDLDEVASQCVWFLQEDCTTDGLNDPQI